MRDNTLKSVVLQLLLALMTCAQPSSWTGTYYYLDRRDGDSSCPYKLNYNPLCPAKDGEVFNIVQDGQRISLRSQTFSTQALTLISDNTAVGQNIKLVRNKDKILINPGSLSLPIYRNLPVVWTGKYERSTCTSKVVCCPIAGASVREYGLNFISILATGNDACKNKEFYIRLDPKAPETINSPSFQATSIDDPKDKTIYTVTRTARGITLQHGTVLTYEILQ